MSLVNNTPELAGDVDKTIDVVQSLRDDLRRSWNVHTVSALSNALRRRFFRGPGDLEDFRESWALLQDISRPSLVDIGTARLKIRPEIYNLEKFWVQWQPWIAGQGYMLPERFRPDWIPSWINFSDPTDCLLCTDYFGSKNHRFTDAVRIEDGRRVFLKLIPEGPDQELEIAAYFSSEPMRSDPRNHCYPLLDVLRPPFLRGKPHIILVFPLLRPLFEPDPDTVGDMLVSIIALAEGLAFMHEHHVAHRDIHYRNAMMDATYLMPEGWHPWMRDVVLSRRGGRLQVRDLTVLPRSQVPMGYFLTDFGMSVKYESFEDRRLVTGIGGLNRTLPEQFRGVPYDPFPADVRMFGDMICDWQLGFLGLGFLDPVVAKLRHDDPRLRPTASEMVVALKSVAAGRSRFTLQLPLRRRDSPGTPAKVWFQYLTRVLSTPHKSCTGSRVENVSSI